MVPNLNNKKTKNMNKSNSMNESNNKNKNNLRISITKLLTITVPYEYCKKRSMIC